MSVIRELDEYFHSGRHKDGLNRCNKLLKKTPTAPLLLSYKVRFLHGLGLREEVQSTIKVMLSLADNTLHHDILDNFDLTLWRVHEDDTFPPSLTNGPGMIKYWNQLIQVTPRSELPRLHKLRYEAAVEQGRWIDVGHTLTAWKKIEPDRVDLRFAHAAVYQIISENTHDAMTKRLNSQLAIKTCEQLAKTCTTSSQIRTIINIVKRQGDPTKLETTRSISAAMNPDQKATVPLQIECFAAYEDWQDLYDRCERELVSRSNETMQSGKIVTKAQAVISWKTVEHLLTAAKKLGRLDEAWDRLLAPLDNEQRIAGIAKMWRHQLDGDHSALLSAIMAHFDFHGHRRSTFSEIRSFALSLPPDCQTALRTELRDTVEERASKKIEDLPFKPFAIVELELTMLKVEFLLTIGQAARPSIGFIYTFVGNVLRLKSIPLAGTISSGLAILAATALFKAHHQDPLGNHLLFAVYLLRQDVDDYAARVLLIYVYIEIGLPELALDLYVTLSIKEIQHESMSHLIATRLSIMVPSPMRISTSRRNVDLTDGLLTDALEMYMPTMTRIVDQQTSALTARRADLMFELEDLRKSLENSITRRILVLEHRRVARLTDLRADEEYIIHPAVRETWVEDLKDSRSYNISEQLCKETNGRSLEQDLHFAGRQPDADWIKYHLWIDTICSRLSGKCLVQPEETESLPISFLTPSNGITGEEIALALHWEQLRILNEALLADDKASDHLSKELIEMALEELLKHLERLPVSFLYRRLESWHKILPVRNINLVYLLLDFIKAVANTQIFFIDTKRFKSEPYKRAAELMAHVWDLAEKRFEDIQAFISQRRLVLKPENIQRSLQQTAQRAGLTLDNKQAAEISKCAHEIFEAADGTLECMMNIKLHG